jgi:hypothetical protein
MTSGEAGWRVEYNDPRSGQEMKSPLYDTRELALDQACARRRYGDPVFRVIGPHGEVMELPEIDRHCQQRATS